MPRKTAKSPHKYDLGGIVETIFFDDMDEKLYDKMIDFSIDIKGRVRLSTGMVNMDPREDDDMNYVPAKRFDISGHVWNSHQQYVEIELPNPALDIEYYKRIRQSFINEMHRRVPGLVQELPSAVKDVLDGPQ